MSGTYIAEGMKFEWRETTDLDSGDNIVPCIEIEDFRIVDFSEFSSWVAEIGPKEDLDTLEEIEDFAKEVALGYLRENV